MISHSVTYWAVPPPPTVLGGRSSTLDTTPGVMADPNNQTKQMAIPIGKLLESNQTRIFNIFILPTFQIVI